MAVPVLRFILFVIFTSFCMSSLAQAQSCRDLFIISTAKSVDLQAGVEIVKAVYNEAPLTEDVLILKMPDHFGISQTGKIGVFTHKQLISSLAPKLGSRDGDSVANIARFLYERNPLHYPEAPVKKGSDHERSPLLEIAKQIADLSVEAQLNHAKIVVTTETLGLRSINYLLSQNIYVLKVSSLAPPAELSARLHEISVIFQRKNEQDLRHQEFLFGKKDFSYTKQMAALSPAEKLLFDFGFFINRISDPLRLQRMGLVHPERQGLEAIPAPATASDLYRIYRDLPPLSLYVRWENNQLQVRIEEAPISLATQIFGDFEAHPQRILLREELAPYLPREVKDKLHETKTEEEQNQVLANYYEQAMTFYLNLHFAAYQKSFFENSSP